MISKEVLLQELAKQLQAAQAGDAQATREALTAIRALCDVALHANASGHTAVPTPPIHTAQPPIETTIMQTPPQSLSSTKRVEQDGANGDSIFDF